MTLDGGLVVLNSDVNSMARNRDVELTKINICLPVKNNILIHTVSLLSL